MIFVFRMLVESKHFNKLCEYGTRIAINQSTMLQKHSALLIDSHGSVVSWGYNQNDRCRLGLDCLPGLHAEIDCLRKIPVRHNKKLDMIILHPSRTKDIYYKPSCPCNICLHYIRKYNIRKIYYVDSSTERWTVMRPRDMTTTFYSSMVKHRGIDNFKIRK